MLFRTHLGECGLTNCLAHKITPARGGVKPARRGVPGSRFVFAVQRRCLVDPCSVAEIKLFACTRKVLEPNGPHLIGIAFESYACFATEAFTPVRGGKIQPAENILVAPRIPVTSRGSANSQFSRADCASLPSGYNPMHAPPRPARLTHRNALT